MSYSIVCGTDLEPSGQKAVAFSALLAKTTQADVHVVHAGVQVPDMPNVPEEMREAAKALTEKVGTTARLESETLDAQLEAAGAAGITLSHETIDGRPWEVLVEAAKRRNAEYLVVGSHSQEDLADRISARLLGTTAGRVLRHAPCSTWVISQMPSASDGLFGGAPKLVVGVDFAPASEAAVRRAGKLVEDGGEIILFHSLSLHSRVVEGSLPTDRTMEVQWGQKAEEALLAWAKPLLSEKATVRAMARTGLPSEELCDIAKQEQADAIVMGTHGRTGVAHAFFGSVAERTVTRAPVPVLIARG